MIDRADLEKKYVDKLEIKNISRYTGTDKIPRIVMIACLLTIGLYLLSTVAAGQSPVNVSDNPIVTPAAPLIQGQGSMTVIGGFVLDQDGKPVPNATVTLFQDGEIWRKYAVQYGRGGTNPQLTFVYDNNPNTAEGEGVYYFGSLDPGNYTVKAEKEGYYGSTNVDVSRMSTVNVTLNGYHVRAFSAKELAYTGGITGIIQDSITAGRGELLPHVLVTLWRDGRPADIPKNPQNTGWMMITPGTGNYLFAHLAPGQYLISAEVMDFAGVKQNMTRSVTVGNDMVNVSFLFGQIGLPYPAGLPPEPCPTVNPGPTKAASMTPSPFPGGLMMILALTVAFIAAGALKK